MDRPAPTQPAPVDPPGPAGQEAVVTGFLEDWQEWRARREERLTDPHGWLAITAMHWLTPEPQVFTEVPGRWSYADGTLALELAPGEIVDVDAKVLTEGRHDLGPLDAEGLTLRYGDAVAVVADRAGALLRPRHPRSPHLTSYGGTPCFPPDPRWVLSGHVDRYPAPEVEPGPDEEVEVGEVRFEYDGREHRLVAWGEDDGSLWILFRDATSGVTTYPANRQLLLDPPALDGTVEIDFNRATNMPCAYTEYAVCPLPPAANTLPFAVEAGEQIPILDAVVSGDDRLVGDERS